jgi:hypothetical protein
VRLEPACSVLLPATARFECVIRAPGVENQPGTETLFCSSWLTGRDPDLAPFDGP